MSTLEGKYGHFINSDEGEGWESRRIGNRKKGFIFPQPLFHFSLLYPNPLTWFDKKTQMFYRPDKDFVTNLGSTPFFTRANLPQNQYPRSYSFHDSVWLHGFIWVCIELNGDYIKMPMGRWSSNNFLYRWVDAEGGRFRKGPIFLGVSLGAAVGGLIDRVTNGS